MYPSTWLVVGFNNQAAPLTIIHDRVWPPSRQIQGQSLPEALLLHLAAHVSEAV